METLKNLEKYILQKNISDKKGGFKKIYLLISLILNGITKVKSESH